MTAKKQTHIVVRRFNDKETKERRELYAKVAYTGDRAKELEKNGFIKPIDKSDA